MAFQFAREADPTRFSITTTIRPRGRAKSDAVFNLVSGLVNQGVPIDGVGWQMHQINPFRIQQAHRTNAQRLGSLGLEVSITEMDVRISLPTTAQELSEQALAYRDLVEFCLAQPNVKTLVTWGFTDKYSWIPGFFSGFGDALIFDMNYQPKPAYTSMLSALGAPPPPLRSHRTRRDGRQCAGSIDLEPRYWRYRLQRETRDDQRRALRDDRHCYRDVVHGHGADNGTTYFYVVSAFNANGESANSSQVSATPIAANFTLSANPQI